MCNICNSDVGADGICRRCSGVASPAFDLRDEVERAFEEARAQIAEVLRPVAAPPPPPPAPGASRRGHAPPPPPPALDEARGIPSPTPPPPALDELRGARALAPPPPPPTVEEVLTCRWDDDALRALAMPPPPGRDPIAAFAPAPRMDWGPQREPRRERRSTFGRRAQPEG